ncbi:hypothetical protein [Magnetospirillum sp. SS-4]|uniref:hypothetical protein n=1 Tax=Magnetospirillum sp. SS-4 TaxID=2681465 RepID=UPI001574368D|nr:hypothetical protein [Magnetospirillum sp. SS-4]
MSWTIEQSAAIATIVSLVIAAISLVILIYPAFKYVRIRREDRQHREFETYHGLVKTAVGDTDNIANRYADRQIAAIYELRNYNRYYEVTGRILENLRKAINSRDTRNDQGPLSVCKEIDLTLDVITRYKK